MISVVVSSELYINSRTNGRILMEENKTLRLLNIREAAEVLGIAVPTLQQKRMDIPRIHVGRRILFDPRDLEEYVRAHRSVASKADNSMNSQTGTNEAKKA